MEKPDINDYCGYHIPANDPEHLKKVKQYIKAQSEYIDHLESKLENNGDIGTVMLCECGKEIEHIGGDNLGSKCIECTQKS